MASATEPVESGQEYIITRVDGCQPESLDDFDGDTHLTLVRAGQRLEVAGAVLEPQTRYGSIRKTSHCRIGISGSGPSRNGPVRRFSPHLSRTTDWKRRLLIAPLSDGERDQ